MFAPVPAWWVGLFSEFVVDKLILRSSMPEPYSWRDLLKEILSNPAERDRLATEIGVRPITLTRWVTGESEPRQQNLHQLLQALPSEYRDQFLELLKKDFPALAVPTIQAASVELTVEFFRRVLETRANTPDTLRFWTISRQILQHALRQLDPDRIGMAITVVRCMPPSKDGKVHSLRESEGLGTPPWEGDLSSKAMFLGADSLAGYVVMNSHPATVNNLALDTGLLPAYQAEHEVSAIAWPILFATRIAGCLLLSSRQSGYFASEGRRLLISDYAHLLALAFEPEEFYPLGIIDLRIMPSVEVQRKYFAHFQQRVLQLMKDSFSTSHSLARAKAELFAWQQLEEEFITYSSTTQQS
jgi:hypothetical protein